MNQFYAYRAFNLMFTSDIELPEFVVREDDGQPAEVRIRRGTVEAPAVQNSSGEINFSGNARESIIHWDQFATFQVSEGREIIVDSCPGIGDPDLRLPLLGAILAALLLQRGCFVLHASAVVIDNRAAVFLGNKGQGKSTMAATLYGRGHDLLSDDLVVIQFGPNGQKSIIPGYPQFKLWPDSARSALQDDPEQLPRLGEQYEKRARRAFERFATQAVPLGRIYGLFGGEMPRIAPMTLGEALVQLITHSYISRFGKNLLQGPEAVTHLRNCSELTARMPPKRLERNFSLAMLPDVARLVEEDMASI